MIYVAVLQAIILPQDVLLLLSGMRYKLSPNASSCVRRLRSIYNETDYSLSLSLLRESADGVPQWSKHIRLYCESSRSQGHSNWALYNSLGYSSIGDIFFISTRDRLLNL